MVLLNYFACRPVRVATIYFCRLEIVMVDTLSELIGSFDRVKDTIPRLYPVHIQIAKKNTVCAFEVCMTIHSDVMMLKC